MDTSSLPKDLSRKPQPPKKPKPHTLVYINQQNAPGVFACACGTLVIYCTVHGAGAAAVGSVLKKVTANTSAWHTLYAPASSRKGRVSSVLGEFFSFGWIRFSLAVLKPKQGAMP